MRATQTVGRRSGQRRQPSRHDAFSLIEVIVAVAVFAGAIAVILALLPGLTARNAEAADRMTVQRMPDTVQVELQRMAGPGLGALAAQTPVAGFPLANGLALVASRDGARLHSRDYLRPTAGQLADAEQYYLVECWRFADAPLTYDPAQSALALVVRVSWPYRLPGVPVPIPEQSRHEFMFAMGVRP